MRNILFFITLIVAVLLYLRWHKKPAPEPEPRHASHREMPAPPPPLKQAPSSFMPAAAPPPMRSAPPPKPQVATVRKPLTLPYVLEGNLAIVQGDVLVGAIVDDKAPDHGFVKIPDLQLWPTVVIPYYIPPTLPNPDRVRMALEFFSDTNIQFVPFVDQEDAIFFEDSDGVCKSYVGRVGGHQPIFLNPNCGPHEVAHEIMHALGFLHEQNRADRDTYIQVNFDNVDDKYRDNFEKMPAEFMKVSGLGPFDFSSLMIYPTTMFAKANAPTMQSLDAQNKIQPSQGLSKVDVTRVNSAYPR